MPILREHEIQNKIISSKGMLTIFKNEQIVNWWLMSMQEKAGWHKPQHLPLPCHILSFCLPAVMAAQPYELLRNAAEFSKIAISMPQIYY